MNQLNKVAYIDRFKRAGIEDMETSNALTFMNDFYNYDRSREPGGFYSIHSRPNSQLEKVAFRLSRSATKMNKAIVESNEGLSGGPQKKWDNAAVTNKLPDKIKPQKGSLNAADPSKLSIVSSGSQKGGLLGNLTKKKALVGGGILAAGGLAAAGAMHMKKKRDQERQQ